MFWLHQVTRDVWLRRKQETTPAAIGALPCACIQQMLKLAAGFRSKWTAVPSTYVCSAQASLGELLQVPELARWREMTAHFSDVARTYSFATTAAE